MSSALSDAGLAVPVIDPIPLAVHPCGGARPDGSQPQQADIPRAEGKAGNGLQPSIGCPRRGPGLKQARPDAVWPSANGLPDRVWARVGWTVGRCLGPREFRASETPNANEVRALRYGG